MNVTELAKQAGPLISTPFDKWCENFAALIREAVVQELVAGSGEPDGLWAYDETVMAWREYNREGFDSCTGTKMEAYTKDQLAGAVARERERLTEKQEQVRVGHLHISRHPTSGIWLRHDSGEGMQTDEDKLYQHLSEYWHKEF